MATARPFRLLDFLLLLLVLGLAGAARAGYLIRYADSARNDGPLLVQDRPALERDLPADATPATELDALVRNLKEHRWYGNMAPFAPEEELTAHYSPGYPWLLGWLVPHLGETEFLRAVRWAQCGLGALTAALYFLFALRAFQSRLVALLTGLFCAVYPFWIINTAQINDGVLATFLLAACIHLGARAMQVHGPFSSLLFGLALAGLALVRASCLPFTFMALAWFLLRSRHESRGWLCAFLAFLGFANGLVPWAVRNFQQFHQPIPVVDAAYLHLWIGNNPKATGGPMTEDMYFAAPRDRLEAEKNQPRRYASLATDVMEEVRAQPTQTLKRRLAATGYFWLGERWFSDERMADGIGTDVPPHAERILQVALIVLLVLAFIGWRWTYAWRKESMPASLAVLWIPLPYIFSHAEALHGPRLPLDGLLLTYAAFTLVGLVPGLGANLRDARMPEPEEAAA